jgi:hypothetical protein
VGLQRLLSFTGSDHRVKNGDEHSNKINNASQDNKNNAYKRKRLMEKKGARVIRCLF